MQHMILKIRPINFPEVIRPEQDPKNRKKDPKYPKNQDKVVPYSEIDQQKQFHGPREVGERKKGFKF
ncbi:MAG: hypothetical protein EZS28_005697 [Streblomastix strix]|uniref:Uncharacterized protein n=1 Tax=Streblomastix strix TaxID=222440 RepID=A0A5J4WWT9_9EUKA|nr:MAG: hypothetical protein EZS28_005697 [Streblomastix strix]